MAKFLVTILVALLLPAADALSAGDPFRSSGGGAGLLAQPEFLPVEQAYRLEPSLQDGQILLDWRIAPGYYLYANQFSVQSLTGGDRIPLAHEIALGDARRIYDAYYEQELEVFYDRVLLRVAAPAAARPLTLAVTSQGCADAGLCYPPQTQYLAIDPGTGGIHATQAPAASPGAGEGDPGLATLLGFALLGGMILNLMPCVFPVLSIKVMSLTAVHAHRGLVAAHGLAYTLGVVASFIAVAALLLVLRGAGEAVGWGFQLQSPGFVTALALLFFVMALGFAGQLPWSFGLSRLGQSGETKHNLRSSVLTGVLATAVASPCTAPFMGTALGVALTQSAPAALGIFAALGLGMALPFLALTWMPRLLDLLPRPGPWMETFRQLLAFPLYGTVLWLLWVLGRQTDIDRVLAVGAGMLVVAFAVWLGGRSRRPRGHAAAIALLLAGLTLPLAWTGNNAEDPAWEPFSQQRLDRLRGEGVPVFVNLTADWCITCLANERLALSSARFHNALEQGGIRYLKGDWTRYDPEITELLRAHGRSGVPLYLYFPPGEAAQILPQLLTEGVVLRALDTGAAPQGAAPGQG